MKLQTKQEVSRLSWLLAITYMVSYITRINYGAMIAQMVVETGYSKSLLSMAVTGSFITYGAGQIVSGVFGDRVAPKKLMALGLLVTTAMNALMLLCRDPYQMLIVWCINGFAQSFMWPPLVRTMSCLLTKEDYTVAATRVSWGSSFGTIFVYLVSPLMIALSGWKAMFVLCAGCGLLMLLFWWRLAPDVAYVKEEKQKETAKAKGPLFAPVMIFIMVAIVAMGMLRDGVTTWMPSYIAETYHLSSEISILTGVVLPIFSIGCFQLVAWLYRKKFTNPITCAGVMFGAGLAAAVGIALLTGKSAVASVAFSAVLTGCMHGVNLLLIQIVPAHFERWGCVSTASGVLNSCTYVGSAASTYGIALLADSFGWSFTLYSWVGIALAGTAICFFSAKSWKNRFFGGSV